MDIELIKIGCSNGFPVTFSNVVSQSTVYHLLTYLLLLIIFAPILHAIRLKYKFVHAVYVFKVYL